MVTEIFYQEFHTPDAGIFLRIKDSLYKERSEFQELWVVETVEYGTMLLLDGKVMITDRDEFIYHDMITHPGLSLLDDGMDILIIGGGDGGTIRESLKHNPKSVTLVEIDGMVIECCKKYFPQLANSFNDSRVKIIVDDGVKYLRETQNRYDAILVDSTDPEGPALALFDEDFYKNANRILKEKSFIITQSESPFYHKNFIGELSRKLKRIFKNVEHYVAPIPTYPAGFWSFTFASQTLSINSPVKRIPQNTKFYNEQMQQCLTKYIPKELLDEISGSS